MAPSPTLAHSRPSCLAAVVLWFHRDLQIAAGPGLDRERAPGRQRGKRELAPMGAAILIHLRGVSKN